MGQLITHARHSARLWWSVLLAGALCTSSPLCCASETPEAPFSRFTIASDFSIQGGISADLDGDNHPDLALIRPEAWGQRGFHYRVEFYLTTHVASAPLSFAAEQGGLCVVARDVDGDGDLDLVIKSASSLAPVGVWINDGHGRFTVGDPRVYSRSIWIEGPAVRPEIPREQVQATGTQPNPTWLAACGQSMFHKRDSSGRRSNALFSPDTLNRIISGNFTRGPPPYLLNG